MVQFFKISKTTGSDTSSYAVAYPVSFESVYSCVTTTANRNGTGTGTPSTRGVEAISGSIGTLTNTGTSLARIEVSNPVYFIVIGTF